MKKQITLITVLVIGLGIICGIAIAQDKTTIQKAAVTAPAAGENMVEIKGIIKSSESGVILYDGKENYLLKGNEVLEDMVGKIVEVNGTVEKDGTNSVLLVNQVVQVN